MVPPAILQLVRRLGVDPGYVYRKLGLACLNSALREQGLMDIANKLREIVPNIAYQYTSRFDDAEFEAYWETKIRGMHAFQVQCCLDALSQIDRSELTIIDIGDSSGTHLSYLEALSRPGKIARSLSVNIDPVAVEKARSNGREAILCRAEDLDHEGVFPDFVISFETIEHLVDPIGLLHNLAVRGSADRILISVPYTRTSQFAAHRSFPDDLTTSAEISPEMLHVFELSPSDWENLALFSGFRTIWRRTFYQYPRRNPLRAMAPIWRRLDFEGFVILFLERDLEISSRYGGWPKDHLKAGQSPS